MATLGDAKNIIVGAAQVFVANGGPLEYYSGTAASATYVFSGETTSGIPAFVGNTRYEDTLASSSATWTNVGYTMNGLEVQFQPDFGEVQVDQLLDVARMYKQGMQVSLVTAFAEATLENLLYALAFADDQLTGSKSTSSGRRLNLSAGELGECPVERGIAAVGPGTGDCDNSGNVERVYVEYRALSIENVTVSAKRDEPSMFEVSFRLLPEDASGAYGKIVDRTHTAS